MLAVGLLVAIPFAMPAATGCDPSWSQAACGIARRLVRGMHVLAGVLLFLHVVGRILFDGRLRELRARFRAWRAGPSPEAIRRRRAALRRPSLVAAAWGRPLGPAPAEPRHPLLREWRAAGCSARCRARPTPPGSAGSPCRASERGGRRGSGLGRCRQERQRGIRAKRR